jgi:hypothetical protein
MGAGRVNTRPSRLAGGGRAAAWRAPLRFAPPAPNLHARVGGDGPDGVGQRVGGRLVAGWGGSDGRCEKGPARVRPGPPGTCSRGAMLKCAGPAATARSPRMKVLDCATAVSSSKLRRLLPSSSPRKLPGSMPIARGFSGALPSGALPSASASPPAAGAGAAVTPAAAPASLTACQWRMSERLTSRIVLRASVSSRSARSGMRAASHCTSRVASGKNSRCTAHSEPLSTPLRKTRSEASSSARPSGLPWAPSRAWKWSPYAQVPTTWVVGGGWGGNGG